jgi:acetylglutamate kinase
LEARAFDFEENDGAPVASTREVAELIERAYREANKEIVAVLTEFGVPAVGFQGSDRGLIRSGGGGSEVGTIDWLERILLSGPVVVVSALGTGESRIVAEPVGTVVGALARGLSGLRPEIALFRGDLRKLGDLAPEDRLESLQHTVPASDFQALKTLLSDGFPVFICSPRTLFGPDPASRVPLFCENVS